MGMIGSAMDAAMAGGKAAWETGRVVAPSMIKTVWEGGWGRTAQFALGGAAIGGAWGAVSSNESIGGGAMRGAFLGGALGFGSKVASRMRTRSAAFKAGGMKISLLDNLARSASITARGEWGALSRGAVNGWDTVSSGYSAGYAAARTARASAAAQTGRGLARDAWAVKNHVIPLNGGAVSISDRRLAALKSRRALARARRGVKHIPSRGLGWNARSIMYTRAGVPK